MKKEIKAVRCMSKWLWRSQVGITGLETAIVLIAFVVVAAVFAFAVLTTGLFSSEKAKETATSALGEAQSTLFKTGSIVGFGTGTAVTSLRFKLTNTAGGNPVGLEPALTLVTYSDPNTLQSLNGTQTATGVTFTSWTHDWRVGTGNNVDPGEVVEFTLNLAAGTLGANTKFKIEVKPSQGAVVVIGGLIPLEVTPIMSMD